MINQIKLDRLMALENTTDRFKCEMLNADGIIEVEEHYTFRQLKFWLVDRAKEVPMKMIRVVNETTGELM